MKVYLSGPITGVPNFEGNFTRAEKQVKSCYSHSRGCSVDIINPVIVGKETEKRILTKPSWEDYMKDCLKALLDCDAIVMLPNWDFSKGACIERYVAKELGLEVLYLDRMGDLDYELMETSEVCSREI